MGLLPMKLTHPLLLAALSLRSVLRKFRGCLWLQQEIVWWSLSNVCHEQGRKSDDAPLGFDITVLSQGLNPAPLAVTWPPMCLRAAPGWMYLFLVHDLRVHQIRFCSLSKELIELTVLLQIWNYWHTVRQMTCLAFFLAYIICSFHLFKFLVAHSSVPLVFLPPFPSYKDNFRIINLQYKNNLNMNRHSFDQENRWAVDNTPTLIHN